MLNFTAPDLAVDPTDSTRVDTNSRTLSDIFANSHIASKDTIEGVINVNQNTACILSNWSPNSSHNWRGEVELVFGDCIVVILDVLHTSLSRIA